MRLPLDPEDVPGFLTEEEGWALHDLALRSSSLGPCLEVGSYCGKSAVYLGTACKALGTTLFSIDHHRGSEEHQPGEGYYDPSLYDAETGRVDTFPTFRKTLELAALEETVIPIVAASSVVGRDWATPLGLVFIDGGHSDVVAHTDYESWSRHIAPRGVLAVHDVFLDPAEGGQAPRSVWQRALDEGVFEALEMIGTLGVLQRR